MSYRVITGNRKNFRTGRSSFNFRGTVLVLLTIDDHIHPYFRVSVFYLLATLLSGEICSVNKPFGFHSHVAVCESALCLVCRLIDLPCWSSGSMV